MRLPRAAGTARRRTGSRARSSRDGGAARGPGRTANPVMLVRNAWASRVTDGARFTARFSIDEFDYPSVNIIAKVEGTDPALRDQYVLFSAHQDHDGVRAESPWGMSHRLLKLGGGSSARITRFGWAHNNRRSHHEETSQDEGRRASAGQ